VSRAARLLDLAILGAAVVGIWLGATIFDLISR
jgi:hypothetical protein